MSSAIRFVLALPSLGVATLLACAMWCVVYAGYVGYIGDHQPRAVGIDLPLLVFGLIGKLDKIGAPVMQLIFSMWLADHPRMDVIAGGLLCGTPFGVIGGLYLVAWNVERAFRDFPQGVAVKDTLRSISIAYLIVVCLMVGFGLWQLLAVARFFSDWETVGIVLTAGVLSSVGILCLYAVLSWIAYWATIMGHRLLSSIRKYR
ncbi:MAG: hypothetical protein R3D05_16330 [Dongiaceae bacterium]